MIAKIYHNTRCSKSRATLAILEQNNVEFEVVNYLQNPPSASELRSILQDLGIGARDLMRKGESAYKDLQLSNKSLTEDELIEAMLNHPILIERPIAFDNKNLAEVDHGLIVEPPPGKEIGWVPIVLEVELPDGIWQEEIDAPRWKEGKFYPR